MASAYPCAFALAPRGAAPVRFSCMLWTLEPSAPFAQCLAWVAAAGYQGVELTGEFNHWTAAQRRENLGKIQSLGLTVDAISGVKAGFAVPAQAADFRSQLPSLLDVAGMLGGTRVILLSGMRVPSITAEEQRQTAITNLRWAAERSAAQGVEVVIEPIDLLENPSVYMASVVDAFAIARAVGHPNLRVLYDFYHEQRSFGNLLDKLRGNIDLIGLVHVADVPGRHQPGTGEIDYTSIYRALSDLGYAGWIAMEFLPTGDPAAALRNARLDAQRAMRHSE